MSKDSWARARTFCEKMRGTPSAPRLEEARWFFGDNPIAKAKFDESSRSIITKPILDDFNNWKNKNKTSKNIPFTRKSTSPRFVKKSVSPKPTFSMPTYFDATIDIMAKLKPLCEQTSVQFVRDCLDKLDRLQIDKVG